MKNRKSTNRLILVLFLVLLISFLLPVQPGLAESQVSISTSDNLVTIGDRIHVTIIITTNDDVDKIKLKPQNKEYELAEESEILKRREREYTVFEKNIQLVFFKTGEFEIGPFLVELLKGQEVIETKTTNSVPVTVKTVLTEEDKDIRDLKNPIEFKGDPFYVLKYVIIAVVLTLLIVFLVMWWKKRRAAKPEPVILLSPLDELQMRVKELYDKKLYEKGRAKEHFIELTRIFKHFLFRTYHFQAEDFTTYETMLVLTQKESDGTVIDNMRFLFNTADLVKFARFVPDSRVLSEISGKIDQLNATYRQRYQAEAARAEAQQAAGRNPDQDSGATQND